MPIANTITSLDKYRRDLIKHRDGLIRYQSGLIKREKALLEKVEAFYKAQTTPVQKGFRDEYSEIL